MKDDLLGVINRIASDFQWLCSGILVLNETIENIFSTKLSYFLKSVFLMNSRCISIKKYVPNVTQLCFLTYNLLYLFL